MPEVRVKGHLKVAHPDMPFVPTPMEPSVDYLRDRRHEWAQVLADASDATKESRFYPAAYVCELAARVIAAIDLWIEAVEKKEQETSQGEPQ